MEDTKNEVKKTTKKKTTTSKSTTKKTSTSKPKTNTNNSTTKKSTRKRSNTKKKTTTNPVVKTIEENKIDIKNYDPKEVELTAIDTPEERDDIADAIKEENKQELLEITQEVKIVEAKVEEKKTKNKDKIVDYGIVVVIIGLFILVLTTYLTSAIELSYQYVNMLVIISIAIEALGVAIMLVGTINKD
jgi:cobalamin biosynthesis Mg chelatase CobN